jgi:hypothetical protein
VALGAPPDDEAALDLLQAEIIHARNTSRSSFFMFELISAAGQRLF